MTTFNTKWALTHVRANWDSLVETADCPYCEGTGAAADSPGTECGFCEASSDDDIQTK